MIQHTQKLTIHNAGIRMETKLLPCSRRISAGCKRASIRNCSCWLARGISGVHVVLSDLFPHRTRANLAMSARNLDDRTCNRVNWHLVTETTHDMSLADDSSDRDESAQ